jgi:hypothetical protein
MITSTIRKLRYPLLGAAVAALVLTTTTALAGSGVGGIFNLGQPNTVDAQSTLSGNPGANPLLRVTGTGTAATFRADAGSGIAINGISTSGTGQSGQSTTGHGLSGFHIGATGSTSGVYGQTNSTDPGSAGVTGRNLSGGPGLQSMVTGNSVAPLKVNSSAKVQNLNADLLDGFDSARFWQLGGNTGTTSGTDFLGTADNQALELKVNGQRALRVEPTTSTPNMIGGYAGNSVDAGHLGSVIAGGGSTGTGNANHVENDYDFIGAGLKNQVGTSSAGGASAVVAGTGNIASGGSAFIGAGGDNQATANYATVVSGQFNAASGLHSAVVGGLSNTASGSRAVVAGGGGNTASAPSSFAAGASAVADDTGAFVWSDGNFDNGSGSAAIHSPANDSFTAHATGGFNLWTNSSGGLTGCGIVAGGGTMVCSSSRTVKNDFAPVDRTQVLKRLARIPITTWHYKSEKAGARHIGPMAQDFARAFHFGQGNTGIAMVDADGISLAAIQGLYRQNQALNGKLAGLERQNRALSARLTRLEHAESER